MEFASAVKMEQILCNLDDPVTLAQETALPPLVPSMNIDLYVFSKSILSAEISYCILIAKGGITDDLFYCKVEIRHIITNLIKTGYGYISIINVGCLEIVLLIHVLSSIKRTLFDLLV